MNTSEPPDGLTPLRAALEGGGSGRGSPRKVACIGSRDLSEGALEFCTQLARRLVVAGDGEVFVGSGNARGADQAFARGVNEIDPTLLVLYLPWPGYEREAVVPGNRVRVPPWPAGFEEAAAATHGAWDRLTRGPQALHTRNMAIIADASLCVAWPGTTKWGGGTGTGMRRARALGIPLVDLSDLAVRIQIAGILDVSVPDAPKPDPQGRIPGL